jgi:hypothetical protein
MFRELSALYRIINFAMFRAALQMPLSGGVQFCRYIHTIKGMLLTLPLVHPINKIHYEFKKLLAPYCWHHLWDRCHNPSITDCNWSASIDWWFSTTNMD